MTSLIFRTIAPLLTAVMLVFSVFVLLRGHNEPGGGFIGGLIAASAMAIYGMAMGVDEAKRALRAHPISFAGFGLVLAALSGALSLGFDVPFLTGLWAEFVFDEVKVSVSTPMVFDIGVYFVVFGAVSAIALALAIDEVEEDD
jgi:multicomponent Na+:H+ antiporter subunit B